MCICASCMCLVEGLISTQIVNLYRMRFQSERACVGIGRTDPSIIVEESISSICSSSSEAEKKPVRENEKQTGSMEPPPHFNSHPTDKAAD